MYEYIVHVLYLNMDVYIECICIHYVTLTLKVYVGHFTIIHCIYSLHYVQYMHWTCMQFLTYSLILQFG